MNHEIFQPGNLCKFTCTSRAAELLIYLSDRENPRRIGYVPYGSIVMFIKTNENGGITSSLRYHQIIYQDQVGWALGWLESIIDS